MTNDLKFAIAIVLGVLGALRRRAASLGLRPRHRIMSRGVV